MAKQITIYESPLVFAHKDECPLYLLYIEIKLCSVKMAKQITNYFLDDFKVLIKIQTIAARPVSADRTQPRLPR